MRTVHVFVASSVVEFERERIELGDFFLQLNALYEKQNVRIQWNKPENMSHSMRRSGSQMAFDREIEEADFFFLIVGKRLGKHTTAEFERAWKQFQQTDTENGDGKPVIRPYFLLPGGVFPDKKVVDFHERLEELGYYTDVSSSLAEIKLDMQIELTRSGLLAGGQVEGEEAARRGIEEIRRLIRERQTRIDAVKTRGVNQNTIPEIVEHYEEIRRLAQTYKAEVGVLYDYIVFLYQQNSFQKAIELGEWLNRYYAFDNPGEEEQANVKNLLGNCYYMNNSFQKAELLYREALITRRGLTQKSPTAYGSDLAESCYNLSNLLRSTKRYDEARMLLQEGLTIYRKLVESDSTADETDVVWFNGNLALLLEVERKEEAEPLYQEALTICRKLAENNPAAYEPDLAKVCYNLADLLENTERKEEAEPLYQEALIIRRKLAESNPAAYEPDLAQSCHHLANLLANAERKEEAEPLYREALAIRYKLAKSNPAAYESALAYSCYNLADLLENTEREEEAEPLYREALAIRRKLAENNPAAYEPDLAQSCYNLADLLENMKRKKDAEPLYREALTIRRKLAENNPAVHESDLAWFCSALAIFLESTEREEEAEPLYREALTIRRKLTENNPDTYESDLAQSCFNLASLLYKTARKEEAEPLYREVLAIYRKLSENNPADYESDVANACNNLGLVMAAVWQIEEAEELYRQALEICDRLVVKDPDENEPFAGMIYFNQGFLAYQQGNRSGAKSLFELSLSLFEKYPEWPENADTVRHMLIRCEGGKLPENAQLTSTEEQLEQVYGKRLDEIGA